MARFAARSSKCANISPSLPGVLPNWFAPLKELVEILEKLKLLLTSVVTEDTLQSKGFKCKRATLLHQADKLQKSLIEELCKSEKSDALPFITELSPLISPSAFNSKGDTFVSWDALEEEALSCAKDMITLLKEGSRRLVREKWETARDSLQKKQDNLFFNDGTHPSMERLHIAINMLCAFLSRTEPNWAYYDEDTLRYICEWSYMIYLENWLEHDENQFLTSKKYVEKFELQSDSEQDTIGFCDASERRFRRNREKIINLQNEKIQQDQKTGVVNFTSEYEKSKPVDLVTARTIFLYDRGNFDLMDRLFKDKSPMGNEDDPETFERVLDAYDRYYKLLEELENCSTDEEYVTTCMSFRSIESSCHFLLLSELASWICKTRDKNKTASINRTFEMIKPAFGEFWYLPKNAPRNSICRPYALSLYKEIHGAHFPSKNEINRIAGVHIAINQMVNDLNYIIPVRTMPSWTIEDFKSAAIIFRKYYHEFSTFENPIGNFRSKNGRARYSRNIKRLCDRMKKQGTSSYSLEDTRNSIHLH